MTTACGSPSGNQQATLLWKGDFMGFISRCGKFCNLIWHCKNRHEGECLGYQEPDDDEMEDIIDRMAY